ncbi:MAG: NAD-dependent epimerase/dehydratase family protein, partial [Candidatus Magasanikbacteria bacterium]|nr:NAD-dependent epimerase/dehydratase family protein [Candidatus Magasanikbacteria bacterium]
MLVSLVLPTLNEEKTIVEMLKRLNEIFKRLPDFKFEVIIVDDDSEDKTVELARAAPIFFDLKIISRSEKGLATAVLAGFAAAAGEIIGVIDADLSHPPELIAQMLPAFEKKDLVIASRRVTGGAIGQSWPIWRNLTSRIAAWPVRFLGVRARDPMSGFFFLRKSLIAGVNFSPIGYKILLEILVRAPVAKFVEIPYIFEDRKAGQSKFGFGQIINYLRHLGRLLVFKLKIRFNYMAENNFEKKNILVTGGAGFIGSHLCEELLKDANVICLDSFVNSSVRNIDHLLKNPNFEFIKYDITQPVDLTIFSELERFKIKFKGLQEIYHLACTTSAKDFDKYKVETLKANSVAVINALELAKQYKAKFVLGSSSVVYGPRKKDNEFASEEQEGLVNHLTPRSCYDEGKRYAETAVYTYRDAFALDAKIARIFRTYGPRQRLFDGEMIPDFAIDAIEGRDLVIYGDEYFKTSLVYVSDVVEGLVKLMAAPSEIWLVNFGSDEDTKLVEIAKKI